MVDISAYPDTVNQIMGRKSEESQFDPYDYIRPTMRLDVPMDSCNSIGKAAEILEDLARRLYRISVNHQLPQGPRRGEAFGEMKAAQQRLKQYTKGSRAGSD